MSIALLIVGGLAGLVLAADLCVHLYYAFSGLSRFDNRPPFQVLPPPVDVPLPESVEFPTSNGLMLRGGVYFPPDGVPKAIIVYCPETEGSYLTAPNYIPALVEAGAAVMAFSFRNHEPSDSLPGYRPKHWFTTHEVRDVHAALDFVQSQPQFAGLPVGLMGVSRGACAALAAGAERPEVRRIWAQGAFSTRRLSNYYSVKWVQAVVGDWGRRLPEWHVKVTAWFIRRISEFRNKARYVTIERFLSLWRNRDVQFVCGGRDTYVPSDLTQLLCRATGRTPEQGMWIVPRAKHNMERVTAQAEYDRRLVAFFSGLAELAPQEAAIRQPVSSANR